MNSPLAATSPARAPDALARDIGRWDLVALYLNAIIGAGIFGLPSKVFALLGGYSLLGFVLCAGLVLLIVLCFAEVGSRFRDSGGPYLYTYTAFGPSAGFVIGWLLWLARLTSFAALANLFVDYLGYFWPAAESGWGRVGSATGVVALLAAVNVAGVRRAALAGNLFTVGKLLPLAVFVGVGLFFLEPGGYALTPAPDVDSFTKAVLLLLYAFTGFEAASIPAGEIRDPQRNTPFALLTAIALVTLLYLSIQAVCMGTLPGLAGSARPIADAAGHFLGGFGAAAIAAGALVSVGGTLNANMLASPRVIYAMAERGQLPGWLAGLHPRHRTPHRAIAVSSAIMLALTLSGTFMSALTMSTIIRLLTYAGTCAALLALRRRADVEPARFHVPAARAVVLVAIGLSGWLVSSSSLVEIRNLALALAVGLVIHAFMQRRRSGHA